MVYRKGRPANSSAAVITAATPLALSSAPGAVPVDGMLS